MFIVHKIVKVVFRFCNQTKDDIWVSCRIGVVAQPETYLNRVKDDDNHTSVLPKMHIDYP